VKGKTPEELASMVTMMKPDGSGMHDDFLSELARSRLDVTQTPMVQAPLDAWFFMNRCSFTTGMTPTSLLANEKDAQRQQQIDFFESNSMKATRKALTAAAEHESQTT
jgi:hypothetical protein